MNSGGAQVVLLGLAAGVGYLATYPALARADRLKFALGAILLAAPVLIRLAIDALGG